MSRTLLALTLGLVLNSSLHAADDERKAAQEVLDRAIKAMGGAEPIAKMKSLTWKAKAKISINDAEIVTTEEWSARNLDKYRVEVNLTINGNNVVGTLVINGDKGWGKANDRTNELPKGQATGFQNIFRSGRLLHLLPQTREKPYELSPLGELKIGDRETLGVRIGQKDRPDVSVYFDKKTGLPLKAEVRVVEMEGSAEVGYEVFFNDYKEFDGLKHASKIVVHRDGKQVAESEISDVKPQELDDGVFDKP